MKRFAMSGLWAATVFGALLVPCCHAQQPPLPPAEPPLSMPGSAGNQPVLHVTTTEVLVPTLVEDRNGDVLYGLHTGDFVVEDNGIRQQIRVQEEMDTAPVALVVAVELGGASVLEFGKLSHMGPLLDTMLTDPRSHVALVGFDSSPELLQDFTHSGDEVNHALEHLEPGDGGASILDTVSYGVDLLNSEPKEYRRVLLLISEERDHGSKHIKAEQLAAKVGASDVLVMSVTFRPFAAELAHDAKDSGEQRTTSMISALWTVVQAFKRNVAKEVAEMSGGEYTTFVGDKRFEARILDAARHVRNRYLITFHPSNPTPGLHTLKVSTREDYGARVVARANYWLEGGQ